MVTSNIGESNNGDKGSFNDQIPRKPGTVFSPVFPKGKDSASELIIAGTSFSGKELPELIQKVVCVDNNQALDFAQAIDFCLEFGLKDMLYSVETRMALTATIKGQARQQFLQGIIGLIYEKDKNTKEKREERRNTWRDRPIGGER